MRIVLAFALLLLFAPVASAQQADTPPPPGQTEVQVQELADPELDNLPTVEAKVVQQQIVPAEAPEAVAQPDRRGWWWLVLAFVAAGVILWLVGIF